MNNLVLDFANNPHYDLALDICGESNNLDPQGLNSWQRPCLRILVALEEDFKPISSYCRPALLTIFLCYFRLKLVTLV